MSHVPCPSGRFPTRVEPRGGVLREGTVHSARVVTGLRLRPDDAEGARVDRDTGSGYWRDDDAGKRRGAKRPRRSSAANESLKRKTWDERMEERAKRKALIQTMKEIEDEKRREKEEERERIRLKRERKEANQKKQLMAKAQIVKNTSKIKKMNKKQLRSLRTADVS
ncbi:hypothetical protein FVE85_4487 [Porphyridium purpureum]|uniref:Coiled-coil domain-containing protein 86 n=1 Tax=Porphyridium purpureum TaxID=35688 RepID=A0A5J4YJP0_PORPP|nr:hypothetical protein FVE85_4487 [Porphyridium purpureum]|eukprot:POR4019..scf297_16